MGRWSRIRTIWAKEMLEFIRDWRSLLAIVAIPILAFPLLMYLVPSVLYAQHIAWEETVLQVEVQVSNSNSTPEEFDSHMEGRLLEWTLAPMQAGEQDELEQRLLNEDVEAILQIFPLQENNATVYECTIYYTSTDDSSAIAQDRLVRVLTEWSEVLVEKRITDADLGVNATLNPVRLTAKEQADTADDAERTGQLLSYFVPALATLWTATMAIQPAIDLTAGERERGTLEALLGAPITRIEALTGKWLAVATFAGAGAIMQGFGFAAGIWILLRGAPELTPPNLGPTTVLLLVLALLLFTVMIVAVQLAIAVRSASVREAGTALTPATLLLLGPILIAQAVRLEGLAMFWYGVPVVNVLLGMREALAGTTRAPHVAIWVITSLIYAGLSLVFAARSFRREELIGSIS